MTHRRVIIERVLNLGTLADWHWLVSFYLSPREILVTKAYTIGRRGSFKDYVDLYTGVHENISQIEEIMTLAREKYGEIFNDRLFLEQLVFVDDIDEVPLEMKNSPMPTKRELVDFFSREIQKIKL